MIALPVKRLDRLIAISVLSAIGLVWVTLVALDALSAFARELDEIGAGSYTLQTAVTYILLTLPRRFYEIFNTAAVIGAVLGLGALAPTAELTAMRAGGMSKWRISISALAAVAALTAAVVAMGETAGPWGERSAQSLAAGAKSKDAIASGDTGLWAREGDDLFNAKSGRATIGGVELFDVRVYEFTPEGQLTRITRAERAEHEGGAWTLFGVSRMQFEAERVVTESVATLAWGSTLDPRLLSLSIVRPRYLSAADLDANIRYLERNGLDAAPYESVYWARVFYPLNVLALVLFTLPFAFGALRSGGLAKRLFLGVLVAVGWLLFQRAAVNVAEVYDVDFRVAHGLPALALLALAAVYFRRGT